MSVATFFPFFYIRDTDPRDTSGRHKYHSITENLNVGTPFRVPASKRVHLSLGAAASVLIVP